MTSQSARTTQHQEWFPFPTRVDDERTRLICLPFAGGGASRFLALSRSLRPDIGCYPAQFPGREGRSNGTSYPDAGALAAKLGTAVAELADRPYAILGYSLGACYAFELVRSLTTATVTAPRALFAVAASAPHTRSSTRLGDASDSDLLERVRQWQAIPPEVTGDPELLRQALDTLRMDLGAWERHQHDTGVQLDCPVYVYTGVADETVTRSQLAGWRDRTSATVRFRTFDGGHFFGFEQPDALAAAIRADLSVHA